LELAGLYCQPFNPNDPHVESPLCALNQRILEKAGEPQTPPAMEAGISDHIWTVEEIAGLVP
jgi:hypothetical protein